jgi:hypothetical protein
MLRLGGLTQGSILARMTTPTRSQWWTDPQLFRAFGRSKQFLATYVDYHGGWSGHQKPHKDKSLIINGEGINLKGFKTLFTIPWSEIAGLDIEGPEEASKRITATRILSMGVFALAAKKKSKTAILIVTTTDGEQAVFQTEKLTALELRAKLTPVISQIHRAG